MLDMFDLYASYNEYYNNSNHDSYQYYLTNEDRLFPETNEIISDNFYSSDFIYPTESEVQSIGLIKQTC